MKYWILFNLISFIAIGAYCFSANTSNLLYVFAIMGLTFIISFSLGIFYLFNSKIKKGITILILTFLISAIEYFSIPLIIILEGGLPGDWPKY